MKKKKIMIGFMMYAISMAVANASSTVLSKRTVELNVDISTTKLKLSRADYSSPVVKVLVPELADVTILDHRNTGEGAPCLATYEALSPEEVIQNNPATEKVRFQVTLLKDTIVNIDEKSKKPVCEVHLTELIEGDIRGFDFQHSRSLLVGNRHMDDCR